MAKQLTDDEQNIRRKQRRRLVGAIALTLAVVVILPMVLDSEPKPAEPNIDLRIPDPDNAGEFVTSVAIPEKSTLPPAETPSEPSAPEEAATEAKQTVKATDKAKEKVSAAAVPTKTQVASATASKAKVSEKPSSASDEGFVAQVGAYSNADTAKQELAKLKKWGFKAYTEKAGGMIRVRVGPYPTREKAEKVAHLLEKHDLKPVILSAK